MKDNCWIRFVSGHSEVGKNMGSLVFTGT